MPAIPGLTQRMICGLLSSITLLFGCGDDEAGDEVAETSSESSSESTSEDSSTDGSTDSTGSEASTESDSTDSPETESDSTDSTESDSTDSTETTDSTDSTETGDPSCEDDSYIGVALANDDWGIGDLCDEIWVCADEDQVPLVEAAVPGAMCSPNGDCPVSTCTISFQTIVDADVFADVCDALLVPGIDEAYCIVLGP